MKFVSELYGRHAGSDIYILGTAPSVRVFPLEFLKDKIVIGCNQAWKLFPVQYCLTIHPDLNIPEFMQSESPRPDVTWITGEEKCRGLLDAQQFAYAEKHFYFFKYRGKPNTQPEHEPSDSGRVLDWVRQPSGEFLYLWSSIAQAAACLAANLGARNIVLVGCDNGSLLGNHHAHEQHSRWKGVFPEHRYQQYYEGMAEVRAALRIRGVNLVSLNPFLKIDAPDRDFARLCQELGKPEILQAEPIASAGTAGSRFQSLRRRFRSILAQFRS
jgi:hypothetical protein